MSTLNLLWVANPHGHCRIYMRLFPREKRLNGFSVSMDDTWGPQAADRRTCERTRGAHGCQPIIKPLIEERRVGQRSDSSEVIVK